MVCELGHHYKATPTQRACPVCQKTLVAARARAAQHGGRLVSHSYATKAREATVLLYLELECAKKHRWKVPAESFLKPPPAGSSQQSPSWCPQCAKEARERQHQEQRRRQQQQQQQQQQRARARSAFFGFSGGDYDYYDDEDDRWWYEDIFPGARYPDFSSSARRPSSSSYSSTSSAFYRQQQQQQQQQHRFYSGAMPNMFGGFPFSSFSSAWSGPRVVFPDSMTSSFSSSVDPALQWTDKPPSFFRKETDDKPYTAAERKAAIRWLLHHKATPAACLCLPRWGSGLDTANVAKHYRQLAKLVHPDKCKEPQAQEAFKILQNAYSVLNKR